MEVDTTVKEEKGAAAPSSQQEELHNYLKSKDLNSIFVSLVEEILINKPDNPIGFMTNFLLEKYPEETKHLKMRSNTQKPPSLVVANDCNGGLIDTESDTSSVKTDASVSPSIDDPSNKPPLRKKRRESVCAENIKDNDNAFELKVIEKTESEKERILQILKSNVFFNHLDEDQMKTIQHAMFLVEKTNGDVIINQGDDGDNFYIIDSGIVDVFIKTEGTDESDLVKTCEAGDAFGELAIMYNAPRAASCIAKGDVRLWALDRVSFKVILMKTTIAKRDAYKGFLEKVESFSELTEYEILTIADALVEETFQDGAIICSQGDRGDKFYLIKDGTAVCTKTKNDGTVNEVAILSPGEYFGEIALLTTKTRQATVTAKCALKCLSLERRTFTRVMGSLQELLLKKIPMDI